MSRGNISFTTVNIVRIAIEAKRTAERQFEKEILAVGYTAMRSVVEEKALEIYFVSLQSLLELAASQLHSRFMFQAKRKAKQFPFLFGQNLWIDGATLGPNDTVEEVIKHGSLGIGFIGLAEALVMLTGEHHGQTKRAQKLGLKIISTMRRFCDKGQVEYNLNYTLLATPAEGLSGRFVGIDRKKYGNIDGVTDREYYTNSNHVPVYFPISAYDKIEIESAYHPLTNAGHILYVEMDTTATKNTYAFAKIIRQMFYSGAGYGAVNHTIQRCFVCSFEGEIKDACPKCGETEMISELARITGYLVGTDDKWNSFKLAEKRDRITHS